MIRLLRVVLAASLAAPAPSWAVIAHVAPVNSSIGNGAHAAGSAAGAALTDVKTTRADIDMRLGTALPGATLTLNAAQEGAGVSASAAPGQAVAASENKTAPDIQSVSHGIYQTPTTPTSAGRQNAAPTQKKRAPASALESARKLSQSVAPTHSLRTRMALTFKQFFDGGLQARDGLDVDHSGIPTDMPAEGEDVTREISENPEDEPLDLRFTRDSLKSVKASEITASIRLVKGKGSQWYWEKFAADIPVRLLVGGRMSFFTRITHAETKEIATLTRKDFEGHYPRRTVWGKTRAGKFLYSLAQLRQRMVRDLTEYAKRTPNPPRVINAKTQVRVIHFMPYNEARHLPENDLEPDMEPRLRKPVSIPAKLKDLHRMLPKLVIVDLRLFGENGIPFELLEDMGKLMKAGMYFVFMSEKPQDGPGSISEMITKQLTLRQRDDVVRYKLLTVPNNGNALYKYQGSFARPLPARRFAPADLELLAHTARRHGAADIPAAKGYEFIAAPKEGVSAGRLAEAVSAELLAQGMEKSDFAVNVESQDGREVVAIRPNDLPGAIPNLLKVLQDTEGMYVNNSDVMMITQDKALLKAMDGAIDPAGYAPNLDGADLVDMSYAALLGAYRENMPGDLAASASSITSFKFRPDGGGSFNYNIYMLLGHVMHSSFNWLVWVYRNTGELPSAEALHAKAMELWRHEDNERVKHLLETSGETLGGYLEAMEFRLKTMHASTAHVLKTHPIVIGTELPTLMVAQRYKKGETLHRDIFRGLYDFVVARKVKGGLEIAVVDFKSGQTPTMQTLANDTQVQLYDIVSRTLWHSMGLPYGVTGVNAKKVVAHVVNFIFPPAGYQPTLTEWSRLKFEKWLFNIMNRMRKRKAAPPSETKKPKKAPAQQKTSGPRADRTR